MAAAYRSLLAPWMGGASIQMNAPATVAFRSPLALWMGGASSGSGTPPPATNLNDWLIIARRRIRR